MAKTDIVLTIDTELDIQRGIKTATKEIEQALSKIDVTKVFNANDKKLTVIDIKNVKNQVDEFGKEVKRIVKIKNSLGQIYSMNLVKDGNKIVGGSTSLIQDKKVEEMAVKNINNALKAYVKNMKDIDRVMLKAQRSSRTLTTTEEELVRLYRQSASAADEKITDNIRLINSYDNLDKVADEVKKTQDALNLQNKSTAAAQESLSKTTNTLSNSFHRLVVNVVQYMSVQKVLSTTQRALEYVFRDVIDLNKAMTDIQVVTGGTREETTALAAEYSELGKELGQTTQSIAESSTEWLRQGKSVQETNMLVKQSAMLARLGAIENAQATEYLTSTLNGYQMEANEASHVVDALSAVDLKAATSTAELAEALQKTANSGREAGVGFEALVGWIAAVSESTRKSAPTIGEGFKTIISRFQGIAAGKEIDDFGEPINDVEKSLTRLGIKLRDNAHNFRNLEDVIDEIAQKWNTFSEAEKSQIATAAAGVRQRENFLALMSNYSRALELEETALNSNGIAAEKYEAINENLEASFNRLKVAVTEIFYDESTIGGIKMFIDSFTTLLGVLKEVNPLMTVFFATIARSAGGIRNVGGLFGSMSKTTTVFDNIKNFVEESKDGLAVETSEMFDSAMASIGISVRSGTKEAENLYNAMNKLAETRGPAGLKEFRESVQKTTVASNKQVTALASMVSGTKGIASGLMSAAKNALYFGQAMLISFAFGKIAEMFIKLINHTKDEIKDLTEEVEKGASKIEEIASELEGLKNKTSGLNEEEEKRVKILENQLSLMKKQQETKERDLLKKQGYLDTNVRKGEAKGELSWSLNADNLKKEINATKELTDAQSRLADAKQISANSSSAYNKASEDVNKYTDEVKRLEKELNNIKKENEEVIPTTENVSKTLDKAIEKMETYSDSESGKVDVGKFAEWYSTATEMALETIERIEEKMQDPKLSVEEFEKYEEQLTQIREKMLDMDNMAIDMFSMKEAVEESGYASKEVSEAFSLLGYTLSSAEKEAEDLKQEIQDMNPDTEISIKLSGLKAAADSMNEFKNEVSGIQNAFKEMEEQGQLSLDTVLSLAQQDIAMLGSVVQFNDQTGVYELNKQAALDYMETKKQLHIAELKMQLAEDKAKLSEIKALVASYDMQIKGESNTAKAAQASAQATLANMQSIYSAGVTFSNALGAVQSAVFGKIKSDISKTKESVNVIKNAVSIIDSQYGGIENTKTYMNALEQSIELREQGISVMENYQVSLEGIDSAAGGSSGSGGATGAEKALNDELERQKEILQDLKDEFEDTKKVYEAIQNAIEKMLDEEKEKLDELMDKTEERQDLMDGVSDLIIEWYEEEIDKAEELKDSVSDLADAQREAIDLKIDALEKEADEQDRLREIEEARLEVEKAQMALDEAKKRKGARVYTSGAGWEYKSDPEEIAEKQEELNEAQKNYNDLVQQWGHDKQIEALEEQQKAIDEAEKNIEEYIDSVIEGLEKEKEAWNDALDFEKKALLERQEIIDYLKAYEKASYEERMAMLAAFEQNYEETVIREKERIEEQIQHYEDLKDAIGEALDIEDDLSQYTGALDFLKRFENANYEERKQMIANFSASYKSYYKEQTNAIANMESAIDKLSDKMDELGKAADAAADAIGRATSQAGQDALTLAEIIKKMQEEAAKGKDYFAGFGGHTGGGMLHQKYASGGLGPDVQGRFGSSQVVNFTGWSNPQRTNWVDGTPSFSELMLNASDASKLWRWIQTIPQSPVPRNNSNNDDGVDIGTMIVQAPNNATLNTILTSAKQQARVGKYKGQ